MDSVTPEQIRLSRAEENRRDRDLARHLGIREAEIVAAFAGAGAVRIDPHPDTVVKAAQALGDVMALTRNESCVHEKDGFYDEYHTGEHAAMVLGPDIDLRMFPAHWCHAFLWEIDGRKSIQVFDAAGDAVHKIYLRDHSDHAAWERLKTELAVADQSQTLQLADRKPVEAAKSNPDKADTLRAEWARMTDTHQFLRMVSKLKMNRLGAYRIAGEPLARAVDPGGVDAALHAIQAQGIDVMIFTGNRGCIQIHSGPIETLKEMGPWQNVLDPRFNLHLKRDRIAEVWAVSKPTKRGAAVSLEAFDEKGEIILQIFGIGKEGQDSRRAWEEIVKTLTPVREMAE
ncbi:MAG: hemin-degrading factor [Silicimonas sp.]|nr:hemin-degrading factor [Silicimonas sp.]